MRSLVLILLTTTLGCASEPTQDSHSCGDCADSGPADLGEEDASDMGSDAELDADLGLDMLPQEPLFFYWPRLRLNDSQIYGTTSTSLSENGRLSRIAVIAKENDGSFEYETRLYYTDEEPIVQNASPHPPILWEDRLTVLYVTVGRSVITEFSLDFELQPGQVELPETVFGIYKYGNQVVAYGEENISFLEKTLLGLEVTKQIPRDAKPLPDFGTPNQHAILGNVIYDVVRTMDGGKVLVAWNLEAEGADDALLGVTEEVQGADVQFSVSVENELIVSSGPNSESFELFSLQVPPVFLGTFDSMPYLSRDNLTVNHTIYKDWLILKTKIRGGDDVDYFVLDVSTENLDCIGQIQDGEFNRFGAANVVFIGLQNEIMVREEIFQHNILDGIPIVSMQPEDFVLGPCP